METRNCLNCGNPFPVSPSNIKRGWDKYCSWGCYNAGRKAHPERRFWKFVDKSAGPDGCWLWMGTLSHNGYGRFWLNGHNVPAHQFSLEQSGVVIPEGHLTLHHCDNPCCVNPAHLFTGTQLDNVRDRDAKNRTAKGDGSGRRLHPDNFPSGDTHWTRCNPEAVEKHLKGDNNPSHLHPESRPRGEDNRAAKLTWDKVREIRRLKATGLHTNADLAKQYNVSAVLIGLIVRGKTWKE